MPTDITNVPNSLMEITGRWGALVFTVGLQARTPRMTFR